MADMSDLGLRFVKKQTRVFPCSVRRVSRCSGCGGVREIKWSCDDCIHSFVNPFDERFCRKGRTATRLCSHFARDDRG